MPQPICFMIMPYGTKPTQADPSIGVANIDFNALWDRAYAPVIEGLGYKPVRADQDTNALILSDMIRRLFFSDLVLADMTVPNGNVYYEVGVRHAAKRDGCVLLAADWSKPLFDVAQIRTIRYPLKEGAINDSTATAISAAIKSPIEAFRRGDSPVFGSIRGYPTNVDPSETSTMKGTMLELSAFQGQIRAVRAMPQAKRMQRAKQLLEQFWKGPVNPLTALTLLRMLKDSAYNGDDWQWIVDFVDELPSSVTDQDEVRNQALELRAFASSYGGGKHVDAVATLEAVIEASGPTPERLGLLGGRYKRLFREATTPADATAALNKAIGAYERGMELDLNQYYCSSNLPRLYRQRKRKGDELLASLSRRSSSPHAKELEKRNVADEWLNATLLGASFDAHECDKAEELAAEVGSAANWQIESTLGDLKLSVSQVEDKETRDRPQAILDTLQST